MLTWVPCLCALQVKYYGANDFETDRYDKAIARFQVRIIDLIHNV